MQRQVPTAFRVSAKAVEEFHTFSMRCWTLDNFFYELLVSGNHTRRSPSYFAVACSARQSTVAFGRISQCLREGCAHAVRNWKSGHHFYVLPLTELFLCNAWLTFRYIYLVNSWRLLDEFPSFSTCWVDSDPVVDSRPALRGDFSRVSQHGEACTVDASTAWSA